jgi:SAM-dependent methyltransferase
MGIDFSQIQFFDICHKHGGLQTPLLGLGSLAIRESKGDIEGLATAFGYTTLRREQSVRAFFLDRYNISDYRDCDINGSAEILLDLNKRIPENMVGAFGTVLNGGTLEHVFDIRQAMENLHRLVRPNGSFIHMVPVTWYEHGFMNFNPVFFHTVAEANDYTTLAEGFYFLTGAFLGESDKPCVLVTRGGGADGKAADRLKTYLCGQTLPANMMYLIAMRKKNSGDFRVPYQVSQ